MGLGNVVGKPFYAMQETKLVALLNITFVAVYIFLACILTKQFSYLRLAAALSLKTVLIQLAFLIILSKLLRGINGKQILDGGAKVLMASLVAYGAI